jgi:hypothetical protein
MGLRVIDMGRRDPTDSAAPVQAQGPGPGTRVPPGACVRVYNGV